jgi:two-component system chemotaxis response regulator CheB
MARHRNLIVIGGSAGGIEAMTAIVAALPPGLRAAVLVVLHTSRGRAGGLHRILERSGQLPVSYASHGAPIEPGRIQIAPSDYHLVVTPETLQLVHGPKEHGFRPAIDPLFRTAADVGGPLVVGVILSGGLDDGSFGLSVVKARGGIAIVQRPDEAEVPSMPLAALRAVSVDYVRRAAEIGTMLGALVAEPLSDAPAMTGGPMHRDDETRERAQAIAGTPVERMEARLGAASALTCPDCGGALWKIDEGRVLRYACHVGHQFAPASLVAEQREAVETALWVAVRALEEQAELRLRMARRFTASGLVVMAQGFEEGAQEAHRQAQQIRDLLFSNPGEVRDRGRPDSAARRRAGRRRRALSR